METVNIGTVVRIRDLASGREMEYSIVPHHEADASSGKISIKSPLGKGLIGCRENEEVEIKVPAGKQKFRVLSIFPGL